MGYRTIVNQLFKLELFFLFKEDEQLYLDRPLASALSPQVDDGILEDIGRRINGARSRCGFNEQIDRTGIVKGASTDGRTTFKCNTLWWNEEDRVLQPIKANQTREN